MNLDHNAYKILVIDDEKHIRQSFADFLEDQSFEVLLAENGRIGMELIEAKKPDLVILDLRMPEMDGLEVLKQVKEKTLQTPMIVISGANRIGDVVQAIRLGASDYLEKPVQDFSILSHAVEKALETAQLIKENQAYQENLENLVKKRTSELEKANLSLSDINARLHKIVETSRDLTGCVELRQLCLKILNEFAEHMAVEGGSLYLVDDNGLKLMHALDPGHAPDFIAFPLIENSIFSQVLNKGQPVLFQEFNDKNQTISSGWKGYNEGSLLAFPILDSNSRAIGVITLHNKKVPPFVEQDKEIGSILASFCCETIRAIEVFEQLQESEKQLRQSQKMEAIGTLAGGIAHDFNNILSGIIGYAQLVEMSINEPENIKKNINQVMTGTRRASELVNQILSLSRQDEYEKKPIKIYLIVKEAVKLLRSSIPSTIDIVEKINTKGIVLADATQIHQVVMNLCTNAFHAMRETGGTLSIYLNDRIKDQDATESDCEPGPYIELLIKDTGRGIEDKNLEKIFDPYFTTKKISQGTGLGLAVVNGIVKKHHGFITVSSTPDQGTKFHVFFPIFNKTGDKTIQKKIREDSFLGSEKIMLVDDEKDILDSTQRILEKMGYNVQVFLDGESAFEAFQNNPEDFDLIITDMTMPKMEGSTLSKKILSIRKEIPIILCTGFSESFSEESSLQIGIRRYVNKPVSGRKLASIIREELEPGKTTLKS